MRILWSQSEIIQFGLIRLAMQDERESNKKKSSGQKIYFTYCILQKLRKCNAHSEIERNVLLWLKNCFDIVYLFCRRGRKPLQTLSRYWQVVWRTRWNSVDSKSNGRQSLDIIKAELVIISLCMCMPKYSIFHLTINSL